MGSLKHIHNRQFRFILYASFFSGSTQTMDPKKKKHNLNFYR